MQSNKKWIRTSFCWCLQVYRVNKNAWPRLKKVNPHNNTRKNLHEHKPCEAWFPSYNLLMIPLLNSSKAWPASSPDFSPLDFYLRGHLIYTVYATEVSNIQDLQRQIQNWFLWHLGFSSKSGNQCADMQHPELKLKVKVLTIFFHLQESMTRNHASEGLCS